MNDTSQTMDLNPTTTQTFEETPLLDMKTNDIELLDHICKVIKNSVDYYKGKNIYERQQDNRNYYLGVYAEDNDLKDYQSDFGDNAIYEAESTIVPIATSRLPDMVVKASDPNNPESVELAENVTKVIENDLKQRKIRKAVITAVKHVPIYFFGALKYRWDPNRGKNGDYVFEFVHPSRLTLDHTAKSNDVRDMNFIAEKVELTVQEAFNLFPSKKQELADALSIDPSDVSKLGTPIEMDEVWFKWFDKNGKRINGVMFKYGETVLLDKQDNPNWDWEGEEKITMDLAQLRQTVLAKSVGIDNKERIRERIFHNFFEEPEFPYIILGYDQLGEMPIDETSRIEQVIRLQKNLTERGRQITNMVSKARGKNVFSADSGFTQEMIEELDMDDPNSDIIVKGDVRQGFTFIPSEQPTPALINDKQETKRAIFEKMGTNSTTRGNVETDTATVAQIARESDYGRIDHFTEETVNYAFEKIARAILQMIKLRYTEDHYRRVLGKDAQTTMLKISRDMVEDGMEVEISASATAKAERRRLAIELAQMKLADPLSIFKDLGLSDPEKRAEMLIDFSTDPATYLAKHVMGLETTEQQVSALDQISQQQLQGEPQATPQGQVQPQQPQSIQSLL